MPDKTPPWPPRQLGPGTPSEGRSRRNCRKMRKIIHLQHHNKNTSFKKPNFFQKNTQKCLPKSNFQKSYFFLVKKNTKKCLKKHQLWKILPEGKKKTLKKGRENTHFAKIPAAAIFRSQKRLKKGRENQNSDPNLCVQKSWKKIRLLTGTGG